MAPSPKGDASPSQVLPLDVGAMSWRLVHKWSPRTLFASSHSAASSQAISHQLSFTSKVCCCLLSTGALTLLTLPPKGGAGFSVLSWFVTANMLPSHLRREHIDPRVSRSMRPRSKTADIALAPFSRNHPHLSLDFQHNTDGDTILTPHRYYEGETFGFVIIWFCLFCWWFMGYFTASYVCVQKSLVDSPQRWLCPLGSPFCTAAWRYWMN